MCDNYCRCRDTHIPRQAEALDLQDGCNLRAIARALVRAADEASNQEGGTAASYRDAAVILIVNKLESLVHSEQHYSRAYRECLEHQRPTY